jgi:hypothetical protein
MPTKWMDFIFGNIARYDGRTGAPEKQEMGDFTGLDWSQLEQQTETKSLDKPPQAVGPQELH